jgi:hypothetical protein
MLKIVRAIVLALPFVALAPGVAHANGYANFGFAVNVKAWANPCCPPCGGKCCGPAQAMPWYLYWPYEAHFQTPAFPEWPYWPTQSVGQPGGHIPGQLPAIQPVGHYQAVPYYWYGK